MVIETLRPEQADEAAHALAESFFRDPVYDHVFTDERRRLPALRSFLTAPVRDTARNGIVDVAIEAGHVVAVGVWLPPGRYPWGPARRLRALPAILGAARRAPAALPRLARIGAAIDRAFPDDPVWYLQVLGVRPQHQGAGLGTRLLAAGLARVDADGAPAYLETVKPENVRLYQRHGFEVLGRLEVLAGVPRYWTMRRPPASRTG